MVFMGLRAKFALYIAARLDACPLIQFLSQARVRVVSKRNPCFPLVMNGIWQSLLRVWTMKSMGIQWINGGSLMIVAPIYIYIYIYIWGIIRIRSGNPFWQTSTRERRNRLNAAQIGPRNPPFQTTQGLVGSLKINGWCIAHCCRFGPQCRWWKVPFVKAVWLGLLADKCFFWDSPFLWVNHILW